MQNLKHRGMDYNYLLYISLVILIVSVCFYIAGMMLLRRCRKTSPPPENNNYNLACTEDKLKQRKLALEIFKEDMERVMVSMIDEEKYEQCDGLNIAIKQLDVLIGTIDASLNSPDK